MKYKTKTDLWEEYGTLFSEYSALLVPHLPAAFCTFGSAEKAAATMTELAAYEKAMCIAAKHLPAVEQFWTRARRSQFPTSGDVHTRV